LTFQYLPAVGPTPPPTTVCQPCPNPGTCGGPLFEVKTISVNLYLNDAVKWELTSQPRSDVVVQITYVDIALVVSDPHLIGMDPNHTKYDFGMDKGVQGYSFNMLTEEAHQFNVYLDHHTGDQAFPDAATWVVGAGLMYADQFSLTLRLDTTKHYELRQGVQGANSTRAVPPAGGFHDLISELVINDADTRDLLESGNQVKMGDVSVYFPSNKHKYDPTDGPVAVVTTPDIRFEVYLESEDTWHLDFSVTLLSGNIERLHGALGQTLHWTAENAGVVEGGDMAYALNDGLLGKDFKYNLFTGEPRKSVRGVRRNLQERMHVTGGSHRVE
jgi:hypothetical protein